MSNVYQQKDNEMALRMQFYLIKSLPYLFNNQNVLRRVLKLTCDESPTNTSTNTASILRKQQDSGEGGNSTLVEANGSVKLSESTGMIHASTSSAEAAAIQQV